jgi:hypothetical protein
MTPMVLTETSLEPVNGGADICRKVVERKRVLDPYCYTGEGV